jgi:hypothetical protein
MHEADIVMSIAKSFMDKSPLLLSLLWCLYIEGRRKKFQGRGLAIQLERDIPLKLPQARNLLARMLARTLFLSWGISWGEPLNSRGIALLFGASDSPLPP